MIFFNPKALSRHCPAPRRRVVRKWPRVYSAIAIVCLLLATPPAEADKRVALVIGNGAYRATNHLANPPRDARAMAKKLEALGFTVHLGIDLTHAEMETAQQNFVRSLDGANVAL